MRIGQFRPSKASGARARGALFLLMTLLVVAGCGDGSDGGSSTSGEPQSPAPTDPADPTDPTDPECSETFDSTYDAIQSVVFERQGCTAEACHGSAASGGLDLSADVSYANLFNAASTASELSRVHPGTKERSFLWLKLLAASDSSVSVGGSPMPLARDPLSANDMELVRRWIQSGAPQEGTVLETEELVDGCLPDPQPISIEPLDPPTPDEGIQMAMPPWPLAAGTENEVCFATWADFSDQIPDEFKSEDGNFFYYKAFEVRQDPASHHLVLHAPGATLSSGEYVDPSVVNGWACMGGANEGQACDPLADPCGDGVCASPVEEVSGCTSYDNARGVLLFPFSGTQQAQYRRETPAGVFSRAPVRMLLFWNSHAFNLTTTDLELNGWANFEFATERQYQLQNLGGFLNNFGIQRLVLEGTAPYTETPMCDQFILPKGARVTSLNSHTHKRGVHFWYELSSGEHVYDSYVYNDPLQKDFDPPLAFDADDPAERTIKYCSLYNNGVDADGNPDPSTVTRASQIPYGVRFNGSESLYGLCDPVRCVNEGMYDVDCDDGRPNQVGDDAACDSSPGAGDGVCDACQIMGGVTTENEMFGADISYYVP